ncbi:MAG: hypothetical protein CMJ83_05450 [Planctomycetes bacterium]|nr:hypothetical protein [Planctomycetota bacterium]
MRDADSLLRVRGAFAVDTAAVPWRRLLTVLVVSGFFYGAVMGSSNLRLLQMLFSGLKVPVLLLGAAVCCLPSFFVVNTLLGLRDDFAAACRGILAAQATVGVVLLGLAPITAVVYASTGDYAFAVTWNGGMFLVAALGGQLTLIRHYRPLVTRDPKHKIGRASWLVLYVFVTIQLAWVLRPFIGYANLPTRFFRADTWDNAYVVVVQTVLRALGI